MSNTAISVEGLSKLYRIGLAEERHESLVTASLDAIKAPLKNFRKLWRLDTSRSGAEDEEDLIWALRDVTFQVPRGEVLGVIGRNGAGKSTLLKILSRVTAPTSGRVVVNGRVSSLLEVGTGFHPELTGRDNIYLNATILGMTKREIDRKFDEIVDFSGVEKFLDTPVKRYSSGMKVRLAFSVAAHLEPEILIVDEVLAVGDYEFQRKCLGKMENVARGGDGRTVLFVSHNMGMMRSLCNRGILLRQGRVCFDGDIEEAVDAYMESYDGLAHKGEVHLAEDPSVPINILDVSIRDAHGGLAPELDLFEAASLRVRYRVAEPIVGMNLGFFVDYRGSQLFGSFDTDEQPVLFQRREPGDFEAWIELPTQFLKPGAYSIRVAAGVANGGRQFQNFENALKFVVRESANLSLKSYSANRQGLVAAPLVWHARRVDAGQAGDTCLAANEN